VFLGRALLFHSYGAKLASIYADLAPVTQVIINNSLIAAFFNEVIPIADYGTKLYAAIRAAKAEVANLRSSTGGRNETCLLTDVQNLTGFLDADFSSYASIDYVLHRARS